MHSRRLLLWLALALSVIGFASIPTYRVAAAAPSSPANIWLTGHDLDYHCSQDHEQCNALKVAVTFVRDGSTLPLLILDEGTQVTDALSLAFAGALLPDYVVQSPISTDFTNGALLNDDGSQKYSAIVIASDNSCGGCDNNVQDIAAIYARRADIAAATNKGTGILALAGANNYATYYRFLPLVATGVAVSPPFHYTAVGLSFGLIEGTGSSSDDNCCATHNSFLLPPLTSPYKVAELDGKGKAETLVARNVTVTGGGTGITGSTANLQLRAECTIPTPDENVLCGSNPPGCLGGSPGPDPNCTQIVTASGTCVKDSIAVASGFANLGSKAGTFSFPGLNACSVRPYPVPAGDAPCVASKSFCYGAILDIAGTGTLTPTFGSPLPAGRFPFNLHVVDEDTGVAERDSDLITLTITPPNSTPYVEAIQCFPPHGGALAGCSLEVTGHGEIKREAPVAHLFTRL